MGGSLVLRLAADHPDAVAGIVLVNPAVNTTRLDVKALPVLKWLVPSLPGIANDIKKPGVEELGYARTPLKAADSMMREGWKPLRADLPRITAPLLLFKSTLDHVVDPSSLEIIRSNVSSRDFTERMLSESYHVATLDNDARDDLRRVRRLRRPGDRRRPLVEEVRDNDRLETTGCGLRCGGERTR